MWLKSLIMAPKNSTKKNKVSGFSKLGAFIDDGISQYPKPNAQARLTVNEANLPKADQLQLDGESIHDPRHFPPTISLLDLITPRQAMYNDRNISSDLGYNYGTSNSAASPSYGSVPPADTGYEGVLPHPTGHDNNNPFGYGHQPQQSFQGYTHDTNTFGFASASSFTPTAASWLIQAEILEQRGHPSGVRQLPMPTRHGEPEAARGARAFLASGLFSSNS